MLRPSGVSSDKDDSWPASASSSGVTPSAATTSTARRLPSVMVPVLSRRTTSISPAVSTAFPLLAMIWRPRPAPSRRCRSPPGAHDRRRNEADEERNQGGTSVPDSSNVPDAQVAAHVGSAFHAMDQSGITTIRNTSVKAESVKVSAISFGVRCRAAPSTRAIIRSRNDSRPRP